MRYFAEISYNGARYIGWQIQTSGISVQGTLNKAFSTVLRDDIQCLGCGRTDSGVHAKKFFLHFNTDAIFPDHFESRMNAYLPHDIAIHRIIPVEENAHARYDATLRSYEYILSPKKDVFRYGFVYYKPFHKLNIHSMQAAANILLQFDDFPSFCKAGGGSKTTIVHLIDAHWEMRGEDLVFCISGNRFLRGMVRLIVGAMLQIGEGRMSLETFEEGIQEKKRFRLALSAPAEALYLTDVQYPYIT